MTVEVVKTRLEVFGIALAKEHGMARTWKAARPLTELERARIENEAAEQKNLGDLLLAVLRGTYDCLLSDLGETWQDYGPENRMNPTEFGLPEDDWRWCVGLLQKYGPTLEGCSPDMEAGLVLDWVNVGPSLWKENDGE